MHARVWRNCDNHLIIKVIEDVDVPGNQLPCPHVVDGKIPRVVTMSDCVSTIAICLDCLIDGVRPYGEADQLEAKNAKLAELCQKYRSWIRSLCELHLRYWPQKAYDIPNTRTIQYEYEADSNYKIRGHRFRRQAMLWRHLADVLEMFAKEDDDVLSGIR